MLDEPCRAHRKPACKGQEVRRLASFALLLGSFWETGQTPVPAAQSSLTQDEAAFEPLGSYRQPLQQTVLESALANGFWRYTAFTDSTTGDAAALSDVQVYFWREGPQDEIRPLGGDGWIGFIELMTAEPNQYSTTIEFNVSFNSPLFKINRVRMVHDSAVDRIWGSFLWNPASTATTIAELTDEGTPLASLAITSVAPDNLFSSWHQEQTATFAPLSLIHLTVHADALLPLYAFHGVAFEFGLVAVPEPSSQMAWPPLLLLGVSFARRRA